MFATYTSYPMPVLAFHDNETECELALTPVPDSATLTDEPVELLTERLPAAPPVAAGLNDTGTATDWLGPNVVPAAFPLALKPAPETKTCEMVRLDCPLLETYTFCVLVFESATLPKPKFDVFVPSWLVELLEPTVKVAALLVAFP